MITAISIACGGDRKKRRELDFYPTPPDATHALMQFFESIGKKFNTVWEPACGDGSMVKVIEQYGCRVIGTDITTGRDFTTCSLFGEFDAVITNPPFELSQVFIERALQCSPVVAMLLKSQYWHSKKRIALFEKTTPSYVLPLTWRPDFGGGGSPTMDVLWTVWLLGKCDTRYILLKKPEGAGLGIFGC